MGYKKSKLAVASLMLVSLAACSNNKNDLNDNNNNIRPMHYRNVATDTHDRLNNRNDVTDSDFDRYNNRLVTRNKDRQNKNRDKLNMTTNQAESVPNMLYRYNTTTEIQPSNNGFITITPNSYSTDTPSSNFPHTVLEKAGKYWYYSFAPQEKNIGGNQYNYVGQPRYGAVAPQPGTTGQQAAPTPGTTGQQAAPQRGTQTGNNAVTPNHSAATPRTGQPTTQAPAGISQMAQQVINLTNAERKKAGLPALTADSSLSRVAQAKSNDMEAKHYFSHTSPTYGSPFDMMRDFGVTYKSAGENIAMGQTTAQQVVQAWMNSEGHRKNILSSSYTNIGVGFTAKGNYWSQMFIGK
jgi:uncharacterized YkwD family protein